MPSRNVVKPDAPQSYYHIYARGASKQTIFVEPDDYDYFINLFARYISTQPAKSTTGVPYPHYAGSLELLSYCLMPNHFHLLIYQEEAGAMTGFMRGLMTSYSRYFNHTYKRSGSLFESTYKASRIDTHEHLQHISRYIHLNPRYWLRYPYSSVRFYLKNDEQPEWLRTERILGLFPNRQAYTIFLQDYEQHKAMLDKIKQELAGV